MPNPHERKNMEAGAARRKRQMVLRGLLQRKLASMRGENPEQSRLGRGRPFKGAPVPRYGGSMKARRVTVPRGRGY